MPIVRSIFGHFKIDVDVYNNALKELKASLMLLNTHLQGKEFLVGNYLTVADVVATIALVLPFQTALDAGFRKAIPNLDKWAHKIVSLPEVVARMG